MEQVKNEAIPEWEGSVFERWSKRFVAVNGWRVHRIIGEYEDCMQECYLQYVYCRQHYPNANPRQFNYMFMLAVHNVFDTCSMKESNQKRIYSQISTDETAIESDAQLNVKLKGASSELKSVLKIFLESPKEVMDILRTEASSCHPKQAWKVAVKLAGLQIEKAAGLAKELQKLLN
jgi:hypothetical protein